MNLCCESGWTVKRDGYYHCDLCGTRLRKVPPESKPDHHAMHRERMNDLCAPKGWTEEQAEREAAEFERARL